MVPLAFLFLLSGFSGLIYEVVWVREFGNVFGNTVYSASLIIAVFMLGLGVGGYVVGKWADRQYVIKPESLLRTYGAFEIVIGICGLLISIVLTRLGSISALTSSYSRGANGWFVLSVGPYAARVAIAALLLTPVTLMMGGTLTLLIRYCVRRNMDVGAWRIALLYGVNTAGAAAGAFLTDFALVPGVGLRATQWIAVACNLAVGAGAFVVAGAGAAEIGVPAVSDTTSPAIDRAALAWTSLALALSGFAAMGMEILWFRHFTMVLGGYRAVFSLLLTVILVGIGVGSLAGGWLSRRIAQPARLLMVGEAVFVATTIAGLSATDMRNILTADAYLATRIRELWLITKPMLVEVGVPALVMGLSFPLANATVQRAEQGVGYRAGVLYLANTLGAVCGSLVAGFVLLPAVGLQNSATVLAVAAALTIVPWYLAASPPRATFAAVAVATLVAAAAITIWLMLPRDFVIARALPAVAQGQRQLTVVEGVNEVVSVIEGADTSRYLYTNGHAMSATSPAAQRYMRALAHIPLLSMDRPDAALVIGFGVGNTTHAITLHPTIRRVEVADLSRLILEHAAYFRDANHDVLRDPRVVVYVNDGRQHLRMQVGRPYDLIVLEPPPIAQAGVGALYSTEFYQLARAHLKPGGYISQWLPAYQVPPDTTLAMIRAFVDVFPRAVLLSGTSQELLLIGTNDSRIEIDPDRVARALTEAPAVRADLQRIGLATIKDIVATFVAPSETLQEATRDESPVTDDRPIQEYVAKSRLGPNYHKLPSTIFDAGQAALWCPRCFTAAR